jgi:hypothetical protein
MLKDVLLWLEGTPLAMMVSHGQFGFPALEMIHVTATTFVFGMITIVDLRLIGLISRDAAVSNLYRDVIPLTWAAFVLAAVTGVLLFISQARAYSVNLAFELKMVVLLLIGLNMLAFRRFVYPGIAKGDSAAAIPFSARLAGALSLIGWITLVSCARWIAYLMV